MINNVVSVSDVQQSDSVIHMHVSIFSNSYPIDFPGGSDGKVSACNTGDPGSIPELGRSPGEENGNPLQYSCLENPREGGAW